MSLTKSILLFFVVLFLTLFISCDEDEQPMDVFQDGFDRKEMLSDWADLIIIPAFESYQNKLSKFVEDKNVFIGDPNQGSLVALRASYLDAYKAWQKVSMFDIGKAESLGLRNFTNIYPTNTVEIEANILSQDYNLILPSNFDAQGFPALDYLLFGLAETDLEHIDILKTNNYSNYLNDLVNRLNSLSEEVVADWNNGFREDFINSDGASATASVDKMVNDFLFYYEKYLRAGKIGIPAGVFSGNTIVSSVEAPYSSIHSKALFFEGFQAVQDFFTGKSFDGLSEGRSLKSYLLYLEEQNQANDLSADIIMQWSIVETVANELSDNFGQQIIEDNIKMLAVYDELQLAVILLKVDMMQALNIQVDYVDADGD